MVTSRNTLKTYFETRRFPTQEQFADLIDSFFHKTEDPGGGGGGGPIQIADVVGLQDALDGKSPTNHTHSAATDLTDGFMAAGDKSKLDGIAIGATANSPDAFLLARANHTGSQAISTIAMLQEALDAKMNSEVTAPATPTSLGLAGTFAIDDSYLYFCYATDSWLRAPFSSW